MVAEPRQYGHDSPYSYFRDLAAYNLGDRAAGQRIERHSVEVAHEIDQRSAEGRRAIEELREQTRDADATRHRSEHSERRSEARSLAGAGESRAATSLGNSLGAFVTPQFVVDHWAAFRGLNRTFTDQTLILPLPAFGLTVHVPAFASPASAGTQANGENTAVADLEPTAVDLSTSVFDAAGQVNISQQLHDRGFTGGGGYDVVVGKQLREQLDEQINRYALQQVLQAATSVSASASVFSLQNFYGDVGAARNKVNDTAGTNLRATHVFTTGDLHSYITRVFGTTNLPAVAPAHGPAPTAADADSGYTGLVLPGKLGWWIDDAIPASGSNTKVIVTRPDKVLTFEGTPTMRALPQTLGGQLSVLVQLYTYVATIPQYASATAYVTGNAYPTTLS